LVYLGTVMIIVNLSLSGIMHELAQSGQAGQRIHARQNVEMASDEQHGFSLRALLSLVFTGKRYQRANLSVEIAGTLGFLVLFIYAAGELSRGELTSAGFFILSITAYFISALVPRITAAIPAITQAEQALAQIRFYAKDVH
ncbi:MAG: hypothetical protein INR69_23225, partial [Mucilaginibacter polytrichastri]|nr:hypothetical protein [Mucilaginibacter polytrichastri]